MKSFQLVVLGLSLLAMGSGCQHAAHPSLEMQQKFFSNIKSSNPEEEKALRTAQYYKLVGRFDLAVKELSQAVSQDPQNARLLNALGSCYDKLGDYVKAQEMYGRVLSQGVGNVFALNNLGYSYYLAGDLERADNKFQEVLAKDPGNTLARNNLGLVWCRQGKDKQALTLWQKNEGELAAREKLTQVLALLGKSADMAKISASETGAKTAQITVPPSKMLNKPGKDIQEPEIARTEKIAKTKQPATLLEADLELTSAKTSKPASQPGKVPQGSQVKVEEVEMVIQPASYTQPQSTNDNPLTLLNPTPKETTPPRAPTPAKLVSGLTPQSNAKAVIIKGTASEDEDDDEEEVVVTPPRHYRNYYRSRQWRRYWRPQTVVNNAAEVQKPRTPMKDYVAAGYMTKNQNTQRGQNAVVY